MIPAELVSELDPLVATSVARVRREVPYSPADRDDLVQECWAWAMDHPAKIAQWREEHPESWQGKTVLSMARQAKRFSLREKAAREGYSYHDLTFYSADQLTNELLPCLWDREAWQRPEVVADLQEVQRSTPANERGGWMTMLADVADAWSKLPEADRVLLGLRYRDDLAEVVIADELGVTPQAVNERLARCVNRLLVKLGGERPAGCSYDCECRLAGRRRVTSNARAIAITEKQAAGE